MNPQQKKHTNSFRAYYNLNLIILISLLKLQTFAQEPKDWSNIQLSQKFNHIEFGSNIPDSNISNLFDLDLNSQYCFINSKTQIFIKATDLTNQKLRIQEIHNNYINGSEIYFEKEDKLLILNYLNDDNEYSKLLIINIKL